MEKQIKYLTEALEHARNGAFGSLAIVGVDRNGTVHEFIENGDGVYRVALIGGLEMAKAGLADSYDLVED